MEKISIITVSYNETPERVKYTLDSIVGQTYPLKEIIIIDGGSKADLICAFDPYIQQVEQFISEPDNGIYDAMNKGIQFSSGEWVIFMNVGDRFRDSNVLKKMIQLIESKKVELVCGDIFREGKERISYPNEFTKGYLCYHSICHQSILARRSIFNKIGTFDTTFRLVADRDWVFRAIDAGFRYIHFPVVICDWEIGGACIDYRIEEDELIRYRSKYFFLCERILYWLLFIVEKIYKRLISRNFKIPVRLK